MNDDLDFLRSLRPEPRPDADVVQRHRRELLDSLSGGDADLGEPPPTSVISVGPDDLRRSGPTPTRRRMAVALAAAAALLVGVLGVRSITGDGRTALTTGVATERLEPPADDEWPPPIPTPEAGPTAAECGGEIPAALEVPAATGGPVVLDGPEADPPGPAGQQVLRWDRPQGPVEVRWPASPRPLYDVDEVRPDVEATGGEAVDGTRRVWFSPGTQEDDLSGIDPPEDLVLDTSGQGEPDPGCGVVDVRIVGPDGLMHAGVALAAPPQAGPGPSRSVRVTAGALVTARKSVDTPPDEPLICDHPSWRLPTRSGPGAPSAPPAEVPSVSPTPAGALRAFLVTAEPAPLGFDGLAGLAGFSNDLAFAGFTELLEADRTITYGAPSDGGDGYSVLISVVPTEGGWVVDGWGPSDC